MNSNPICHPSPAKKNEMLIFRLHSLLMISRAGQWTRTPSATPLQPKKMKCSFSGLRSTSDDQPGWSMDSNPICHPSPAKKLKCSNSDDQPGWSMDSNPILHLYPAKNEMLLFRLCSTSDNQPGWSMDSNPIHHPSPAKTMKCSFLDDIQLLMIGQASRWTHTPSTTPLQPKK